MRLSPGSPTTTTRLRGAASMSATVLTSCGWSSGFGQCTCWGRTRWWGQRRLTRKKTFLVKTGKCKGDGVSRESSAAPVVQPAERRSSSVRRLCATGVSATESAQRLLVRSASRAGGGVRAPGAQMIRMGSESSPAFQRLSRKPEFAVPSAWLAETCFPGSGQMPIRTSCAFARNINGRGFRTTSSARTPLPPAGAPVAGPPQRAAARSLRARFRYGRGRSRSPGFPGRVRLGLRSGDANPRLAPRVCPPPARGPGARMAVEVGLPQRRFLPVVFLQSLRPYCGNEMNGTLAQNAIANECLGNPFSVRKEETESDRFCDRDKVAQVRCWGGRSRELGLVFFVSGMKTMFEHVKIREIYVSVESRGLAEGYDGIFGCGCNNSGCSSRTVSHRQLSCLNTMKAAVFPRECVVSHWKQDALRAGHIGQANIMGELTVLPSAPRAAPPSQRDQEESDSPEDTQDHHRRLLHRCGHYSAGC
eukprot:gene21456-biopygen11670